MRMAIFLGAGASASEGAPLQSDLFRSYFLSNQSETESTRQMNRALAQFFRRVFEIDVQRDTLDFVDFPTFEEALGILDLAERRRESLRGFDLESLAPRGYGIRQIRQYLVLLMTAIIHEKLQIHRGHHSVLIQQLAHAKQLKDTVFISTNYDILIDNALIDVYPRCSLDYCVDFTNYGREDDWQRPTDPSIPLLKIHGSLNWLYCPTCNSLTLTPKEKGIIRLIIDPRNAVCGVCKSKIAPIIVPPTYFKDMSNVFLSEVWHKSEHLLRGVDHIVFCGYSFPDADIHIKYLMKRIQTNRSAGMTFWVVNDSPGKSAAVAIEEEKRFNRFLGYNVNHMKLSFEMFAKDPLSLFEHRNARI